MNMSRDFAKLLVAMVLLAGAQLAQASSGLPEFGWQSLPPADALSPVSRKYFYNYAHQVPPDYVYRTGRVFEPPPSTGSSFMGWFKNIDRERNTQLRLADESAKGQLLKSKAAELARQLIANAPEGIAGEYAVTVSSFVNLNDLYRTSSLGRYLGEQLISELQGAGVEVIEVRKSPAMMIRRQAGEYGLSRDMDELSFVQDAQAMVVGTYTFVESQIFVNARLVRNNDRLVLSSASLVLGMDAVSGGMLADEPLSAVKTVSPSLPVQVRAFID